MGEARTLADVDKIMGWANLEASEFVPTIQCLTFDPALDNSSVQLMEADSHLLQALQEGDRVVFRGNATDSAVMCTESSTYQVRSKETSNNLLLLPDCKFGEQLSADEDVERHIHRCHVVGMSHEYYEITLMRPRLSRLRSMLSENIFSGMECEEDEEHQGKKCTMAELQLCVQASDREIMEGLQKLQACCIQGFWRRLDFDFVGQVLENLVRLVESQDWGWTKIPGREVCNALEDLFPRNLVFHVLQCFSECGLQEGNTEDQIYAVSEDKVCRYNAEMLLKHIEKMNLQEFDQSWQLTVPDGLKTGHYQLEGLALIDRDSKPEVIRYFPVEELPEGIEERFNALFKEKTKWSLDEITPYIKDLATEKVGVGALLMKHARASMLNGIKVYNSKKPVH